MDREAEPAEGSGTGRDKQEKDGADKTASPDLKPNLVRTSWSGEITVQEDGEPARVTPFSLSIDGAGKVTAVFSLGIFAEDEAQGVREIRAEGRYVSKTGRLEMSFDRTFSKTNTQVTKVPDYAFDASGRLVQIGEHEERFSMILSLRAWGSLKGEADSDREMRGNYELNELSTWASPENPALAARYSDADPTRTAGTWRANRIN